ncbi:restriction endonuclease subunit S [Streptomyces albidoflavus]
MTHIPDSWQSVTLGSFCEFKYGKSLPAAQRDGGEFYVFGSNGTVGSHSQAITCGPTVVVGRKGSFGEVHYSPEACWPIDTTYFIDESATCADLKWLSHLLPTLGLTELNRAAAIPGLNREDAYAKSVLLPSLPEQKRIAAVLDAVDALRAKRREAIALLDDFAQSIFLDMFGDPSVNSSGFEVRELEGLVADGDRINYGVVQPGRHVEGGIPLIRSGDLGRFGVDRSSLMRISPEIESSYVRSRLKGNEILIGCVGAIGAVAVVSNDDVGSNVARAVARVPIAGDADREYVAAYLRMDFAQRYFIRELRTVAQPTLNIKQIKSAPVLFPPSSLRSEFAERVRCVTRQRVTHAAHLATLDELFTSLQHRAFSGTLWDHEATGEAV